MFQFNGYVLDVARGCLRTADREIELRPKSFEVLRCLVENSGRLVTKDELFKAVWPDVVVSDEALTQCISEVREAISDRHKLWAGLSAAERAQLLRDEAALNRLRPAGTADFDLYMRSMLHAIQVMGADHVGLGADWDGGGGVIGMEDITALPRISARLRREGLSEPDIAKIMSGNLLRVLRLAQAGAARP